MRVAMVSVFPDDPRRIVGGVAGVSKYLADEFSKFPDVRLTVVVPQGTRGRETLCEKWGAVTVYRLAREGFWRFLSGTPYDVMAGRAQVSRFMRRVEPDITHFQGATFLAAGYEPSSVLTIHGIAEKDAMWETRWWGSRWLKWLLLKVTEDFGRRRTPHVILISDYVESVLPADKRRKVWRIDNPIADSFFEIAPAAVAGRIFYCGRIMPRKNIAGMIEAFSAVALLDPQARLRIAGSAEPDYLRECRRQVEDRGLQGRVDFLGSLSVKDVQAELSMASCFVLPSFQETAPLSVAEAMAACVPVVAAAVGGIPGMIEHGSTGFLVDPYDVAGIGDAMGRVIADPSLSAEMGRKAKLAVRNRFMASVVAEKTVRVYREILG